MLAEAPNVVATPAIDEMNAGVEIIGEAFEVMAAELELVEGRTVVSGRDVKRADAVETTKDGAPDTAEVTRDGSPEETI